MTARLRLPSAGGMAARIALASMTVALVALVIITVGVLQVGRTQFEHLMMSHGATQAEATAMFQQTVGIVFVAAAAMAALASVLLAALLAWHITSPLQAMGSAAQAVAHGDYSARAPDRGPQEVRTVARSFNRMAESLERQEQSRQAFVAGAAHELLTPLTNLQGYLEGLRDGVIAPDPAVFASLQEETERLVRLSRSLLDLAEAAASPDAPAEGVDLAGVIQATVELMQPAFDRRGISVAIDIPKSVPVAAGSDQATQVLFNLLQNAARYADTGGRVWVAATAAGEVARVEVANTGGDVAATDLPWLFERFYRVDSARAAQTGGSGLGLALVRQIVEDAGGTVGAESRGGVTRFWFTLPRPSSGSIHVRPGPAREETSAEAAAQLVESKPG